MSSEINFHVDSHTSCRQLFGVDDFGSKFQARRLLHASSNDWKRAPKNRRSRTSASCCCCLCLLQPGGHWQSKARLPKTPPFWWNISANNLTFTLNNTSTSMIRHSKGYMYIKKLVSLKLNIAERLRGGSEARLRLASIGPSWPVKCRCTDKPTFVCK